MEELNSAKLLFLDSLKVTPECQDSIFFSRKFLNSMYDFCRLKNLHKKEFDQNLWTLEDENLLKASFPSAVSKLSHGYRGLISMLTAENAYTAKKYLSSFEFLISEIKPLFLISLKEEPLPKNFNEEFEEAMKGWNRLRMMIEDWKTPINAWQKPDETEKPSLEGVPENHEWWFPKSNNFFSFENK